MNIRDIVALAAQTDACRITVTPAEADGFYLQFGENPPANDNGRLSMEPEDVQAALAAFMFVCLQERIDPVYDEVESFNAFSSVLARGGWHPVLQMQMMDHVDALWPRVAPYDPFDDFMDRSYDNVVMLGF